MLLLLELGEMRGQLAIALIGVGAVALGLGTVWPPLAHAEAVAAMLLLPPLVVAVTVRRSIVPSPGLRIGGATVASACALLAFGSAVAALFPRASVSLLWQAFAPHALGTGVTLGVAALLAQVLAERRQARSWLLIGSWTALAFAGRASAWDADSPGWTAMGVLLFAALTGGLGGTVVSYLVARSNAR